MYHVPHFLVSHTFEGFSVASHFFAWNDGNETIQLMKDEPKEEIQSRQ